MILTENNLHQLHQIALSAAKKSGDLIRQNSAKQFTVDYKTSGETLATQVVTEIDLLSQNAILEALHSSIKEFDLALLTEESTDDKSRFEKDYFWCIDPLDGTLPFIEQKTGYAVSIALVQKDGTPVIGVIHDPRSATTYHAVKGNGALKNNKPLALSADNKHFKQYADRSFLQSDLFEHLSKSLNHYCNKLGVDSYELISHGGAAMNACWTIEHTPSCFVKFPKHKGGSLWDYAASACICKESGGWCSDIFGDALELNRQESTYLNHRGIIYASDLKTIRFGAF